MTQTVLLFQLITIEDKCMTFNNFLHNTRYNFIGFCIDGDIEKLDHVGLEIGHFIDIHKDQGARKHQLHGLGSRCLQHPHRRLLHRHEAQDEDEDHGYWSRMPLSEKQFEYAAKDAYTTYKIWKCITIT
ncbi:hypothetical protein D1007_05132 [Hordeum vulgare]|nr:hypothetical protein D1007_05132 [Hordeum vulgare]